MSVGEVEDFATEYNEQLRAMTRPAKEEINALTMVAADYVESPAFAHAVVNVLEPPIHEVIRAALNVPLGLHCHVLRACNCESARALA